VTLFHSAFCCQQDCAVLSMSSFSDRSLITATQLCHLHCYQQQYRWQSVVACRRYGMLGVGRLVCFHAFLVSISTNCVCSPLFVTVDDHNRLWVHIRPFPLTRQRFQWKGMRGGLAKHTTALVDCGKSAHTSMSLIEDSIIFLLDACTLAIARAHCAQSCGQEEQ
jgi:hypothetical protein